MKMWVATIIPKENMRAARKSRRQRGLDTHSAQESLHRIDGQRVQSFNTKEAAEKWIEENATENDYTKIRRWFPNRARRT